MFNDVMFTWSNVNAVFDLSLSHTLSLHFRCSPCVSTDGICGWCQLDFTCTGDNSTCTGGDDNWIRVRPYNIEV